jgi:hypothetical protein
MRGRRETDMPKNYMKYDDWYEPTGGKYANYYGTYDQGTAATATQFNQFIQTFVGQVSTNYVTAANDTVWLQSAYGIGTSTVTIGNYVVPVPETDEQRVEREQQERDEKAKEEARRKRAREALVSVLTEAQRKQIEAEKCFDLQVNDRLYRIRPGCRVERLDPQSKAIESYFCIHPELSHNLPSDDVALSQKLLLEANEKEFLRIANETKVTAAGVTPDYRREAAINEVMQALELAA